MNKRIKLKKYKQMLSKCGLKYKKAEKCEAKYFRNNIESDEELRERIK